MYEAGIILILFFGQFQIGRLFGASEDTLAETGNVLPMFLTKLVFLAFTRITTSGFYATEKNSDFRYCEH